MGLGVDGSSEPSVVWIAGGVRCRWKFRTQCSLDSRWGYVSHEYDILTKYSKLHHHLGKCPVSTHSTCVEVKGVL